MQFTGRAGARWIIVLSLLVGCAGAQSDPDNDAAITNDMLVPSGDGPQIDGPAAQDGSASDTVIPTDAPILPKITPGDELAQLELDAPSAAQFMLRATIPLPAGLYMPGAATQPFGVIDADGTAVPAQIDTVSRYANPADGADVVLLTARVNRPAGSQPGDKLTYSVVSAPYASPTVPVGDAATHLTTVPGLNAFLKSGLSNPGALLLVAYDVDGNRYEIDLLAGSGSVRPGGHGLMRSSVRTYGVMTLASAGSNASGCAALPHFLGVHAYLTTLSQTDAMRLDLRINNGFDDGTASSLDDALGDVYFDRIELWLPKGWTTVQEPADPNFDNNASSSANHDIIQLVAPRTDGKLHMIPQRFQFHRRLAIGPDPVAAGAIAAHQGIAFARDGTSVQGNPLFGWANPNTARYMGVKHPVPDLSSMNGLAAKLSQDYQKHLNIVTSGSSNPPYNVGNMGPVHPIGPFYGGGTGGGDIHFMPGADVIAAASTKGYLLQQIVHVGYTGRQPTAYYGATGEPACPSTMLQGSKVPFTFYNHVTGNYDPFKEGQASGCHEQYVTSQGKAPPYQTNYRKFKALDMQHLIRYTKTAKTLTWLGGDPLAADDLLREAERSHLSYHEHNGPNGSPSGALKHKTNANGEGLWIGRDHGWMSNTGAATFSIADDAWRTMHRPWFDTILDAWEAGQASCAPTLNGGPLGIKDSSKFHFGKQYWAFKTWEDGIVVNGLISIARSVYQGADAARVQRIASIVTKEMAYYLSDFVFGQDNAPPSYVAVSYKNPFALACSASELPPDPYSNGNDFFYSPHLLGVTYGLLGDANILAKAQLMYGKSSNAALLSSQLSNTNNLPNRAALISALQTAP